MSKTGDMILSLVSSPMCPSVGDLLFIGFLLFYDSYLVYVNKDLITDSAGTELAFFYPSVSGGQVDAEFVGSLGNRHEVFRFNGQMDLISTHAN